MTLIPYTVYLHVILYKDATVIPGDLTEHLILYTYTVSPTPPGGVGEEGRLRAAGGLLGWGCGAARE